MKNILKLAWKNIWRNKVRSGVILGAIAIGLFSGTFMDAFLTGWIISTINDEIDNQYSHVQMHDKAFMANYDINAYFDREAINHASAIAPMQIAYRLNLIGIMASPYNAVGVTAKAVWEDEERQVTTVWKQIPDTLGTFLDDDTRMPVVISHEMAGKLKVKLRSKVVFTFQDVHGDMQSIAFRIGGIYKVTNMSEDVFVRYNDIFEFTGLPSGAVHEAAFRFADIETCGIVYPQLKSMFPGLDVQDWNELNPGISMYFTFTDFMGVVILTIFLFALSFGIINTMLMAVLERTRELGMLAAIGMGKRNIFTMILCETIFLTLVGSIVGMFLGIALVMPMQKTGINLYFFMKDYFEDFGFSSIVYPLINLKMFIQIGVLVILAGILSAIYPARKALKLKPLDAIREM